MHTNTCKNNKFIFDKMGHDQIYHAVTVLNQTVAKRGCRTVAHPNSCSPGHLLTKQM